MKGDSLEIQHLRLKTAASVWLYLFPRDNGRCSISHPASGPGWSATLLPNKNVEPYRTIRVNMTRHIFLETICIFLYRIIESRVSGSLHLSGVTKSDINLVLVIIQPMLICIIQYHCLARFVTSLCWPETSHQRRRVLNNLIVTRAFVLYFYVECIKPVLGNKWNIYEHCYQSVIGGNFSHAHIILPTFGFGFKNCHSQAATRTFRQFFFGSVLVFCHLSDDIWQPIRLCVIPRNVFESVH